MWPLKWPTAFSFVLLMQKGILACTCGSSGPGPYPASALRAADIAFIGSVLSVEKRPGRLEGSVPQIPARFRVDIPWKGIDVGEEVEILSSDGTSCDIGFHVDRQYLVFARKLEGSDEYSTHRCYGTKALTGPLSKCVSLSTGESPTGILRGEVRDDIELEFAGANVKVFGDNFDIRLPLKQEAQPWGPMKWVFAVDDLPLGDYELILYLPESKDPDPWTTSITLEPPAPCSFPAFFPSEGGRLALRVVDALGRPAPNLRLVLEDAVGNLLSKWTDSDGSLLLKHQQPDTYRIRVPAIGSESGDEDDIYLPDPEDPLIFRLEVGDNLDLGKFELPFELFPVRMRGRVVLPDGTPVATARIGVNDAPNRSWFMCPRVGSDSEGYFEFEQLYRHVTYTVSASAWTEDAKPLYGTGEWRFSGQDQVFTLTLNPLS